MHDLQGLFNKGGILAQIPEKTGHPPHRGKHIPGSRAAAAAPLHIIILFYFAVGIAAETVGKLIILRPDAQHVCLIMLLKGFPPFGVDVVIVLICHSGLFENLNHIVPAQFLARKLHAAHKIQALDAAECAVETLNSIHILQDTQPFKSPVQKPLRPFHGIGHRHCGVSQLGAGNRAHDDHRRPVGLFTAHGLLQAPASFHIKFCPHITPPEIL